QPHVTQLPEKAIWVANACQGTYFLADQLVTRNRQVRLQQVVKQMAFELHQEAARHHFRPIADNGIRFPQPAFSLTQRTGGQRPSITETPMTVYHHDFNITLQLVMLQSIITNDDITFRMCLQQAAAYRSPIPAYPYRPFAPPGHQYRLIANSCR